MHGALIPSETVSGSRLLSTGAAARIAGCHPTTLSRAIVRGELSAVRLGEHGNYRISTEALAGWLRRTQSEQP